MLSRRSWSWPLLLSSLASCSASPPAPPASAPITPEPLPAASAAASSGFTPRSPVSLGLERFRVVTDRVSSQPWLRDAFHVRFVSVSQGLILGKRGGWWLSDASAGTLVALQSSKHFDQGVVSPDRRHAALVDDAGQISLHATATGALVRTIPRERPWPMRFDASGKLVGLSDCKLWRLDDLARGTPVDVASVNASLGACQPHVPASQDPWWLVPAGSVQPAGADPSTGVFTRVVKVQSDTNDASMLGAPSGQALRPLGVSPRGDWFCAADEQTRLTCLDGSGAERLVSPPGVVPLSLTFDEAGEQMIYALGTRMHEPKEFLLVDMRTGKTSRLLQTTAPYLRFLPGGRRLIEVGGLPSMGSHGATVYDLDGRWKQTLFADAETGDVASIPGRSDRFALGLERGDSRDQHLITIAPH